MHGTHRATAHDIENAGENYRTLLEGLVAGKFSEVEIGNANYLNELIN
jgi:hypothetical protein